MRLSRSLLLWIGLSIGLLAAFALDAPAHLVVGSLRALAPIQTAAYIVRRLGEGQNQIAALLLLIAVGGFVSRRVRSAGAWALVAFVTSAFAAAVLKVAIHRPRPWAAAPEPHSLTAWLMTSSFQSFPSGESATTFALAALLGRQFPRLRVPLLIVASLVAVARVVVGAHAPSDVWAGAMVGLAAGQLAARWAQRAAVTRASADGAMARYGVPG